MVNEHDPLAAQTENPGDAEEGWTPSASEESETSESHSGAFDTDESATREGTHDDAVTHTNEATGTSNEDPNAATASQGDPEAAREAGVEPGAGSSLENTQAPGVQPGTAGSHQDVVMGVGPKPREDGLADYDHAAAEAELKPKE